SLWSPRLLARARLLHSSRSGGLGRLAAQRLLEAAHAATERAAHLGQALCAEHEQHHDEQEGDVNWVVESEHVVLLGGWSSRWRWAPGRARTITGALEVPSRPRLLPHKHRSSRFLPDGAAGVARGLWRRRATRIPAGGSPTSARGGLSERTRCRPAGAARRR